MRSILISAYACEPLKGSEQGVGWNWVLQMAKNNRLHIITRSNNQLSIEENLPLDLSPYITFHYYDTHPLLKRLKNKAKGLYFYYFFWQLGIIPLIFKLNKKQKFDYSMHLTFGSIWMPTFLPFFNIPFIWGPIGGGESVPKPFLNDLPINQRIVQYSRLLLRATSFLNPLILFPSKKAVAILVRTNNSAELIPRKYLNKIKVILETAIEDQVFNFKKVTVKNNGNLIKLVSTGRLVPFKNIISIIRMFKYLDPDISVLLTIIGSGSDIIRIENEIRLNNLGEKVIIFKELNREDVLKKLQNSDIYIFPSLREGGSWALMEAMAIGLPVVCLKWSGMDIITDATSAIQIPVSSPNQMPRDLAEAVTRLIKAPILIDDMGAAGRTRIREVFNWDAKGVFMDELLGELDNYKK